MLKANKKQIQEPTISTEIQTLDKWDMHKTNVVGYNMSVQSLPLLYLRRFLELLYSVVEVLHVFIHNFIIKIINLPLEMMLTKQPEAKLRRNIIHNLHCLDCRK